MPTTVSLPNLELVGKPSVYMQRIRIPLERSRFGERPREGAAYAREPDARSRSDDREWYDGVRLWPAPGSGIAFDVVPIEVNGRSTLIYYAEVAQNGVLEHDEGYARREWRQWLASTALSFLESGDVLSSGAVASRRPYPNSVRPDDETLLRVIRRAYADGISVRSFLSERWGVALPTADDWIRHARRLPGADLPPARRGRPRKA